MERPLCFFWRLKAPEMTGTSDFSEDQIEAGRKLFTQPWQFVRGAPDLIHLPPDDRPEIAFAGRSNVGKSSLINALVGQLKLARASNTPGRTQELNFFSIPITTLYLVLSLIHISEPTRPY